MKLITETIIRYLTMVEKHTLTLVSVLMKLDKVPAAILTDLMYIKDTLENIYSKINYVQAVVVSQKSPMTMGDLDLGVQIKPPDHVPTSDEVLDALANARPTEEMMARQKIRVSLDEDSTKNEK